MVEQTRDDLLYVLLDNLYFRQCRWDEKQATAEDREKFVSENRPRYDKMTKDSIQRAIDLNFPQPSSSKSSQRQL